MFIDFSNDLIYYNKTWWQISRLQQHFMVHLWTSYGNFGGGQKIIIVEKNLEPYREYWFISSITTKYNQWEVFTSAETVLK